ncbi:MAG: hypothetical protein ACYSUI_19885 [Planctomycetota bacterium]|jgi:hypothetical protein
MTGTLKRTWLRGGALTLLLLVLPLAVGGPANDSALVVNDGCASGGGCCFEPGSMCGQRLENHRYYSSGRCNE